MPIPGSVLNSQFPFGIDAAAGMYPSHATLRPLTQTEDTTGQLKNTYADSTNPLYIGLACRKSPLIQVRPQDQESDNNGIQRFSAKFQVNFAKFINLPPETLAQWQINIDGSIYQIFADESDGSGITTRLLVSDAIPYGF